MLALPSYGDTTRPPRIFAYLAASPHTSVTAGSSETPHPLPWIAPHVAPPFSAASHDRSSPADENVARNTDALALSHRNSATADADTPPDGTEGFEQPGRRPISARADGGPEAAPPEQPVSKISAAPAALMLRVFTPHQTRQGPARLTCLG